MANVKIRLLTAFSGPDGTRQAGDVISVSASDAKDYIERGFGEVVAVKKEARSEMRTTR
jgi:hypothetical protein